MKEEEGAKIESSLKEKGDLLNHFRVLGFGILDGGFGIRDFCGLLFMFLDFVGQGTKVSLSWKCLTTMSVIGKMGV